MNSTGNIRHKIQHEWPAFKDFQRKTKTDVCRELCRQLEAHYGHTWHKGPDTSQGKPRNFGVATATPGLTNVGKKRSAATAELSATTASKRPRTLLEQAAKTPRPRSVTVQADSSMPPVATASGSSPQLTSQLTSHGRQLPMSSSFQPSSDAVKPIFDIQMVRRDQTASMLMKKLLSTYRNDPEKIWIIDFEFMSTSGTSPVPFQVSIVTMNDNNIVTSPINYNMSVGQLFDTILPHTFKPNKRYLARRGNERLQNTIQKTYGPHRSTASSTISQIRSQIVGMLTDDVVLVHWGGPAVELLTRVMVGGDHPISPKSRSRYEGIDACVLARAGMDRDVTGENNSLKEIHEAIFERQNIRFHTALGDVRATREIVEYFISQA